jgi:hypothetical protein
MLLVASSWVRTFRDTFIQSHEQRDLVGRLAASSDCFLGVEISSRLVCRPRESVKVRFGALQGCGWLTLLADSLISHLHHAVFRTTMSHADEFRALDGYVQPSTPHGRLEEALSSSVVAASVGHLNQHRSLLRRRATLHNTDNGRSVDSSRKCPTGCLLPLLRSRPRWEGRPLLRPLHGYGMAS